MRYSVKEHLLTRPRELEAAFQDKESIKRLLCFFEEERSHGATVDEATVKTLNVDLINVE